MHPTQFAYKQGHSTEAALHAVVRGIEQSCFNKQFALGLFLDIEGAFNNVSFRAVETALQEANIESPLVTWIVNMLSSQTVTATLGDHSRTVHVRRGTPQGGVLSPLLFNLVMDRLLANLSTVQGIYAQAYADDIIILGCGIDSATISSRVQEGLYAVQNWTEHCGLSISTGKTTAVMFTWRRNWKYHPLKLGNAQIGLTDRAVYLGVTLDAKLSWIPHITSRTAKANRCLSACRRACLLYTSDAADE